MDMDGTIKGLKVNAESISNMLNKVCAIEMLIMVSLFILISVHFGRLFPTFTI